jgi:hypothetical protein
MLTRTRMRIATVGAIVLGSGALALGTGSTARRWPQRITDTITTTASRSTTAATTTPTTGAAPATATGARELSGSDGTRTRGLRRDRRRGGEAAIRHQH